MQLQATDARLPVVTRPQALRRVMTNLLDNALKFGDYAVITIHSDAHHVTIAIRDGDRDTGRRTGGGIAAVLSGETSRNRDTGAPD